MSAVVTREDRHVVERRPSAEIIPMTESASIMQMIVRAAEDKTLDLARVKELWDMKRLVDAEQAKREFFAAMSACQAEMPQVVRKAENSHTKSMYAKLETIAEAITPIYTKHGFSLSFLPGKSPRDGWIRVDYKLRHSGGYEECSGDDYQLDVAGSQGKSNKTPIQGQGSSISYGRRYLTLMIFNIALKNEDNDGNRVKPEEPVISEDQVMALRDIILSLGRNEKLFCEHVKVASLSAIPASQFEEAKQFLSTIKPKGQK